MSDQILPITDLTTRWAECPSVRRNGSEAELHEELVELARQNRRYGYRLAGDAGAPQSGLTWSGSIFFLRVDFVGGSQQCAKPVHNSPTLDSAESWRQSQMCYASVAFQFTLARSEETAAFQVVSLHGFPAQHLLSNENFPSFTWMSKRDLFPNPDTTAKSSCRKVADAPLCRAPMTPAIKRARRPFYGHVAALQFQSRGSTSGLAIWRWEGIAFPDRAMIRIVVSPVLRYEVQGCPAGSLSGWIRRGWWG